MFAVKLSRKWLWGLELGVQHTVTALNAAQEAQKAAVEQLAERLRKTKTDGADGAEGEGLYDDVLALVRYLRARPGSFHMFLLRLDETFLER